MKKYIIEYDKYDELLSILGHEVEHTHYENVATVVVDLTDEEHQALVGAGIRISENQEGKLCSYPADMPYISMDYTDVHINKYLNIDTAKIVGFDGTGVKIALIDTGCQDGNAALANANLIRQDYTGTGVQDSYSHGSKACMVLSQQYSFYNVGLEVKTGMAYGATVYSMKVLPTGTSAAVAAISWCIANGIHIINVSIDFGMGLTNAINAALGAGIIVVCASGNNPLTHIAHPANIKGVICVNGTDCTIAGNPVKGSHLTLDGEPQVTITMYNGGYYEFFAGGTSQSAWQTTGLLAIYKQKYPNLNTEMAINLLRRKALKMDGYTYNLPSTTLNTLLNYETGAGFVSPIGYSKGNPLVMRFADITVIENVLININSKDVNAWNVFFDLPTNGGKFTSVEVVGNDVYLYGGRNINLRNSLFDDNSGGFGLISFVDNNGCVITGGVSCFGANNYESPIVTLTTVILPAITTIDRYFFLACSNLVDIQMPLLTAMYGNNTFQQCTSLSNIYLPSLTTMFGSLNFELCNSLATVNLPSLNAMTDSNFKQCTNLLIVECPSLTTIGMSNFSDCTNLTTVNMPLLLIAGVYSFSNCTSLTTIDMPLLLTLSEGAFSLCSSLKTINLASVLEIGNQALITCTNLKNIYIPSCLNLGASISYDGVFTHINGNLITLTVPTALMTCNTGNPDGDIQYLQANNTVTIVTV